MELTIRKAQRSQRPFKGCIAAPSGAGKTYTALSLAEGLKNGGRVLLIDTENKSSELYADRFDFDVIDIPEHSVETLLVALRLAIKGKYDVTIVDSGTHAWQFILDEKGKIDLRGGNSFTNWGKVTPQYEQLINAIGKFPNHLIFTLRAKTSYVLEENDRGKQVPKKVGMGAVFRDGGEYEFDFYGTMDLAHNFFVEKSRIDFLADKVIAKPGKELGQEIRDWLKAGSHSPTTPSKLALSQGESFIGQDLQSLNLPQLIAYYDKHVAVMPADEKEACERQLEKLQNDIKATKKKELENGNATAYPA